MNREVRSTVSVITNGWRESDLVIIGGRPNMGKTALMISLAAECARNNGIPVAIFSLELSMMQLVKRFERHSGVSRLPLRIDDTPSIDIDYLRSKAKHLSGIEGTRVIFIDYMQLMKGNEVSRSLKSIAKELNITIVCFSQLSRSVEDNEGNRPKLSDIEKVASGAVEYADSILFIYREAYYDYNTKNKTVELTVAKHHDGSLDCIELRFEKSDGSIRNK